MDWPRNSSNGHVTAAPRSASKPFSCSCSWGRTKGDVARSAPPPNVRRYGPSLPHGDEKARAKKGAQTSAEEAGPSVLKTLNDSGTSGTPDIQTPQKVASRPGLIPKTAIGSGYGVGVCRTEPIHLACLESIPRCQALAFGRFRRIGRLLPRRAALAATCRQPRLAGKKTRGGPRE
jgi:hypothetical protein